MSTMRSHLRKFHEVTSEHHARLASAHRQLLKCMGKASGGQHEAMDALREIVDAHEAARDFHAACCQQLDAGIQSDLDAMTQDQPYQHVAKADMTSKVQAFPREFRVTAVPRAGAPEVRKFADVDPIGIRILGLTEEQES